MTLHADNEARSPEVDLAEADTTEVSPLEDTESLMLALADDRLERRIFVLRRTKVMFDRHLTQLYGVTTSALNQAVSRNPGRFPPDFASHFSPEEMQAWKSRIVISKGDQKGLRKPPWAFTEYGIAMLSSVLRSDRAIRVNVAIMRAFSRLRESVTPYATLARLAWTPLSNATV